MKLEEQFELHIRPLVATYQDLGVNAYLRPINDVHVDRKKIGGTGAAEIGAAQVVVGSLMLDFDKAAMAQVMNNLALRNGSMKKERCAAPGSKFTRMSTWLSWPSKRPAA